MFAYYIRKCGIFGSALWKIALSRTPEVYRENAYFVDPIDFRFRKVNRDVISECIRRC